jgi:hypothetical protein
MALYLVSYDINEKDKKEYEPLWDVLREMGAVKILYSEWIVPGDADGAGKIYDQLATIIKEDDRLLVQEVAMNASWDKLLISDVLFKKIVSENARR